MMFEHDVREEAPVSQLPEEFASCRSILWEGHERKHSNDEENFLALDLP